MIGIDAVCKSCFVCSVFTLSLTIIIYESLDNSCINTSASKIIQQTRFLKIILLKLLT